MLSSIPLVVTFRGTDLQGIIGPDGKVTLPGRVLMWLTRIVARKAARVILVSERMAEYLPAGVSYDVIPSGLDLELFRPMDKRECRKRLGLAEDAKIVLFGGRPAVKRKRYALATESLEHLRTSVPADMLVADGAAVEFYRGLGFVRAGRTEPMWIYSGDDH